MHTHTQVASIAGVARRCIRVATAEECEGGWFGFAPGGWGGSRGWVGHESKGQAYQTAPIKGQCKRLACARMAGACGSVARRRTCCAEQQLDAGSRPVPRAMHSSMQRCTHGQTLQTLLAHRLMQLCTQGQVLLANRLTQLCTQGQALLAPAACRHAGPLCPRLARRARAV